MPRSRFALALLATVALVGTGVWLVGPPARSVMAEAGVPQGLALDRAARVSDVRYDVDIRVPESRSEPVRGTIVARFELASTDTALAFDFAQPQERLVSVSANGRPLPPRIAQGHVLIPPTHLVRGQNEVRFAFLAGDAALNRQDDFLYSLFVPARASLTFPCLDQPNLKARWRLSLHVPNGWEAVSNARHTGRTAGDAGVAFTFDETPPISTYLFAFAAGRFTVETHERRGRTLRIFHRETDRAKVVRNLDTIVDLHLQALEWLERYTGINYPFGKFDAVLLPAFQFGGMEHPGAVFYNASALFLEESSTEQQVLARANVIAHEVAHMWFGDLVTMTWFNDVWMKEVFANYLAAKIVNPSFPNMNHDLRFFVQHYPVAYDVDRTAGANPIRQDLANLNDAGSLYGAIIYQKAPIVMRQLESLVGESTFQTGLREYLVNFGFGNAGWGELITILDRLTPLDLESWSRSWVGESGRPTIATTLELEDGRVRRLSLSQSDPRGRGIAWTQPLQVDVGHGAAVRSFVVTADGPTVDVPGAAGIDTPDWVLPGGDGRGYGAFAVDATTLAFLGPHAHTIADPVRRGVAYVTRWENLLGDRLPVGVVREGLLVALGNEQIELNLQLLLDQTRALFWRLTEPTERLPLATRLEPILRRGLASATTTSARAAWFQTLKSIASTPDTVQWLEAVWARQTRIPGLPLAEVDESELAFDLAVRDVPAADEILQQQLSRITNPDRKARFLFIMPAVSRDAGVRRRFFDGLKDARSRTREAWVIDAARYFHHPLRVATSGPLVGEALALVWEIQRTGDIFFPKRWADATLWGYRSAEVAREVRHFIEQLPANYPPRLRWVLLSSADPLFRAAALAGPSR